LLLISLCRINSRYFFRTKLKYYRASLEKNLVNVNENLIHCNTYFFRMYVSTSLPLSYIVRCYASYFYFCHFLSRKRHRIFPQIFFGEEREKIRIKWRNRSLI